MLEKVLDFPNIVNLETDASHENRLFHLLLFLFPLYLKQAMRKGVFKTYIRKQYNDTNVKGMIDIPRHISKNTPFIGNIAYNQREYSYDNAVTELIRHTIEYIKRIRIGDKTGKELLVKAKDEVQLIVEATQHYELYDRRKVIISNSHNPIRHAYYREYRALQHLCLLILKNQEHNIGSGSSQIYGILFDGAWLWEEYISSLVGDMFYHPMNKSGKGAQRLFSENNGLIYPDFIGKNPQQRIIADAKYKRNDGINGDDYLQLLAYMFRFEAKKGYYFYPEKGTSDEIKYQLNSGTTYEENVAPRDDIFVMKHGLLIPDNASDYADFREKMKQSEDAFMLSVSDSQVAV
jgi:5-methylcytosine-specific restriction endonuclease McrBC regulatory subunit McrC